MDGDSLNGPASCVLIRQPVLIEVVCFGALWNHPDGNEGCLPFNRHSTKSPLMEDLQAVGVGWLGEITSHYQDPHVLHVIF